MWGIDLITESDHTEGASFPRSLEGDPFMSMKKLAAFGVALALGASVMLAVPAAANQGGYGEGCTPGFWKNHLDWKSYDDGTGATADDFVPEHGRGRCFARRCAWHSLRVDDCAPGTAGWRGLRHHGRHEDPAACLSGLVPER